MKSKILFNLKYDMTSIGIIIVFSIIVGAIMDLVSAINGEVIGYFIGMLIVIGGFCSLSFIGGLYYKHKFFAHVVMSGKRSDFIWSELICFVLESIGLYIIAFMAFLLENFVTESMGLVDGAEGLATADIVFNSGTIVIYFMAALAVRFYLGWISLKFNDAGAAIGMLAPLYILFFFFWLSEHNPVLGRMMESVYELEDKLYGIWSGLPIIIGVVVLAVVTYFIAQSIKRQAVKA